jgi:N-acetylglutamate synthase-like GNAT family acetyltransferase/2'-5' RNA ligase
VDRSNQLVIVALPAENDYVRKVSSDPEPHLTLLYLGDPGYDAEQIAQITDYVEYAATFLHKFYLDVEDRGTLGDGNADVLFFNKSWSTEITRFREVLLQNPLISAAFNSTEQFEGWIPHLTLGFPETPAKIGPEDPKQGYSVSFDRVALWTSKSAGPTFDLKPYSYEAELAMAHVEEGRAIVEDFLSHHGVKGMKWGVHKKSPDSKPQIKQRTESLGDVKTSSGKVLTISGDKTPALAKFIARMSPAFRKKVEDSQNFTLKNSKGETVGEMSLKKESPTSMNVVWVGVNEDQRGKGYASAAMKAAVANAKKQGLSTVTLEVPGKSPDARHIYEKMGFKEDPSKSEPWDPVWGGLTAMELNLKPKTVTHGEQLVADFLEHHGVKGMKWGVRRSQSQLDRASGRTPSADAQAAAAAQAKVNSGGVQTLSNHELQGLVNRLNLEKQYSTLQVQNKSDIDRGLQATQKVLKIGKTVEDVRRFLETPSGKALKRTMKGAFAAGKVAAAAYTGGTSGAAAAGASLAVRRTANHFTNVGR